MYEHYVGEKCFGRLIVRAHMMNTLANMMYDDTPLYGANEEMALIEATAEDGAEKIERRKHPYYIVCDVETDCRSNIEGAPNYLHRPMREEAATLKLTVSGSYEESFADSFSFDGYDCVSKFCDSLFRDKPNRYAARIAHGGGGYDKNVILIRAIEHGAYPHTYIRQGSIQAYNLNEAMVQPRMLKGSFPTIST